MIGVVQAERVPRTGVVVARGPVDGVADRPALRDGSGGVPTRRDLDAGPADGG